MLIDEQHDWLRCRSVRCEPSMKLRHEISHIAAVLPNPNRAIQPGIREGWLEISDAHFPQGKFILCELFEEVRQRNASLALTRDESGETFGKAIWVGVTRRV